MGLSHRSSRIGMDREPLHNSVRWKLIVHLLSGHDILSFHLSSLCSSSPLVCRCKDPLRAFVLAGQADHLPLPANVRLHALQSGALLFVIFFRWLDNYQLFAEEVVGLFPLESSDSC